LERHYEEVGFKPERPPRDLEVAELVKPSIFDSEEVKELKATVEEMLCKIEDCDQEA